MSPNTRRFEQLRSTLAEWKVDGVISITVHACTPFDVESKTIGDICAEEGVPFLHVRTDYSPGDEGQLRTRSWEDNGITRYVTEILVKTTGTMQMLGRAAGAQTQPEEGQQFSAQPQPEPQSEAGTKKGGAKTKGRGRKAAQPEPQLQPPEGDDYGFSDDIPF